MALLSSQWLEVNHLLFESITENSISKLQLTKRTYSEIELLTGLIQMNEKGETPLLVAIKGKNVSFIHELIVILKNFTRKTNKCQSQSPMCLVAIEQLSQQIPITELIEYFIKDIGDSDWLQFLAQVFIKSTLFTQQDKIVALEMIGASVMCSLKSVYLDSYYNECYAALRGFGLECWREAMNLRHSISHGSHGFPRKSATVESSVVVFGASAEVMTREELDLFEEHITRNSSSSLDYDVRLECQKLMRRQGLLVLRRIHSEEYEGRPFWLYLKCLFAFGSDMLIWMVYRKVQDVESDNNILINTCHFILEQTNGFDPKLVSLRLLGVFIETLNVVSCSFFKLLMEAKFFNGIRDEDEYQNRRRSEHLSYANLLAFTEFINKVANLDASLNPSTISSVKFESFCFAEIVFNFLFVYKHISRWMKNEEKNKLEDYYSHFIQKLFPEGTTTVLHVAVKGIKTNSYTLKIEGGGIEFGIRNKLSTFHSMIKLILKLGADPNAKDEIGRTPLHILAGMKQVHLNKYLPIFQTLVNAGSYLHMADNKGETVLDILKKLLMRYSLKVDPYFESLISNVFPLTCYCARVIRRHRIPFEDRLPRVLRELVSR